MRPITRVAGALMAAPARRSRILDSTGSLTVLGWHRFGNAADGLTTSVSDFVSQLDVLQEWGATVLPLRQAQRLLQAGELPHRAVALTFDDGYLSVLEDAWPILRDRRLPATLFAVSGYLHSQARFPWDSRHHADPGLVRLACARQLRDAADDGLEIGSHTVSHRWLPQLCSRDVFDEVSRSRVELEQSLGRSVDSFAYPMGGWGPSIRDAVESAGYEVAVTVDRGRNTPGHDDMALRRAFAFDRPEDFRRQLDGAFDWMRPIEMRRGRKEPTW